METTMAAQSAAAAPGPSRRTLDEQHRYYLGGYNRLSDPRERAVVAAGAKDYFAEAATGQPFGSMAAVYFQFWSTIARRAKYAGGS